MDWGFNPAGGNNLDFGICGFQRHHKSINYQQNKGIHLFCNYWIKIRVRTRFPSAPELLFSPGPKTFYLSIPCTGRGRYQNYFVEPIPVPIPNFCTQKFKNLMKPANIQVLIVILRQSEDLPRFLTCLDFVWEYCFRFSFRRCFFIWFFGWHCFMIDGKMFGTLSQGLTLNKTLFF